MFTEIVSDSAICIAFACGHFRVPKAQIILKASIYILLLRTTIPKQLRSLIRWQNVLTAVIKVYRSQTQILSVICSLYIHVSFKTMYGPE